MEGYNPEKLASNQEEMFVMLNYLQEKISAMPKEMDSLFLKAGLKGNIKKFGIENSNLFFVEDVNGNKITLTSELLSELLN